MILVEQELYIFYFDLRKYSFLAKNFDVPKQIGFLEKYHKIVEEECLNNLGTLYFINGDTSVYYFKQNNKDLIRLLIEIKNSVDEYFTHLNYPCRLHISGVKGIGTIGEIKINNASKESIFGEVMNNLQKTISFSESELAINSNDKIILHESILKKIEDNRIFEEIEFCGTGFISLK